MAKLIGFLSRTKANQQKMSYNKSKIKILNIIFLIISQNMAYKAFALFFTFYYIYIFVLSYAKDSLLFIRNFSNFIFY